MLLTEMRRIMMIVVWISVYPAFVVTRVPVDNDTTRFEFTRLFAFYQTGGPSLSYATVCSRTGCFSPLSRAVGISRSYSYTTNDVNIHCIRKTCILLSAGKVRRAVITAINGLFETHTKTDKVMTVKQHNISSSRLHVERCARPHQPSCVEN